MKILQGLLAGIAGAVVGFAVAAFAAAGVAKLLRMSDREGGASYFAIAVGILGGLAGLGIGIFLLARTAAPGLRLQTAGGVVLALVGIVATAALALWAWVSLREDPVKYGGRMSSLEMEFRLPEGEAPKGEPSLWLHVEVQTPSTRPAGTVLCSKVRTEGGMLVVPVEESPLIRSSQRLVVVRLGERQTEVFNPHLRARPDPKAGWTEWRRADRVDVEGGAGPAPRAQGILEMRARVSVWGE